MHTISTGLEDEPREKSDERQRARVIIDADEQWNRENRNAMQDLGEIGSGGGMTRGGRSTGMSW